MKELHQLIEALKVLETVSRNLSEGIAEITSADTVLQALGTIPAVADDIRRKMVVLGEYFDLPRTYKYNEDAAMEDALFTLRWGNGCRVSGDYGSTSAVRNGLLAHGLRCEWTGPFNPSQPGPKKPVDNV